MTHRIFIPVIMLMTLAACSSSDEEKALNEPPRAPEVLYNEAREKLTAGAYKDSAEAFSEVERLHPYSQWANHAEIMSAFASYQAEDYPAAISAMERYVRLYPNNDSTSYAYYLIALCYYEQISDVGRDQKMTENALQALREVVRRFPESDYARDAKIKIDLTIDHLAGKEMQVGRYYLVRNDYLAAINRFKTVVENYQTTTHVPEALHRLVEAYLQLGVIEEATKYASVLGYNYPSSLWYRDSYKLLTDKGQAVQAAAPKESSWWDSITP